MQTAYLTNCAQRPTSTQSTTVAGEQQKSVTHKPRSFVRRCFDHRVFERNPLTFISDTTHVLVKLVPHPTSNTRTHHAPGAATSTILNIIKSNIAKHTVCSGMLIRSSSAVKAGYFERDNGDNNWHTSSGSVPLILRTCHVSAYGDGRRTSYGGQTTLN